MSSEHEPLRRVARDWLAVDPDPDTRAELTTLLDADDVAGLAERFGSRLPFGTAGMRGPLGAGPARMNRAVVRQVTAGLVSWLDAEQPDAAGRGVVVGGDARHKSAEFVADACAVLAAAGFVVHRWSEPVATPLVAYATRVLDAAAGVQVTASHNPAGDNGYKVYRAGGLPLVAPADAELSSAIDHVGPVDVPAAVAGDHLRDVSGLRVRYLAEVASLARLSEPADRSLRLVLTPLHGVAGQLLVDALAAAGFTDVHPVAEQFDPHPDFPTLESPNPEHPRALDRALALAEERDADLMLATDPDGDRLAVAVPEGGGWRRLSGDETGCLLADALLEAEPDGSRPVVATTVVSSGLLDRVAAHRGARCERTLTGFKWLAPVAEAAADRGERFVLGYEQALGVMVGGVVRDKDGVGAAVAVADVVAALRAAGSDVPGALAALARRHGLHRTVERSRAQDDARPLAELRADPPRAVGGVEVAAVADHIAGIRRDHDGTSTPLATPATELLGLELADGSTIRLRPSGTEPIVKCYVEVIESVADDEPLAAARRRADARVEHLADAAVALL